ncbi:MAG TPA: TolC family protein [Bacteroidales bacterium]|nr:TolC family protein [Bacteroidales bacterium]
MKKMILFFLLFGNIALAQQNEICLQDCYDQMLQNYPLAEEPVIYSNINELKMKNLKSGWLPQTELKAQATYQSDVIDIDIDIPMGDIQIPQAEKDQYKATVDINQLIYDWGRIKASKQLENAELKVNRQNNQVELNQLKEQINKFYFAILIFQKNEELMSVMMQEVEKKESSVESGVKNGVLLPSDLNVLKAEKLKLRQNINQIKYQRVAALNMLAEITGMPINENSILKIPEYELDENSEWNRPEHQLFDLQKEKIDYSIKAYAKHNKPMIFTFSQLGYGKPGLNMLNNEFDTYYYLGLGVRWKFWDWNQNKRQREIFTLNKDIVQAKEKSFNKQLEIALNNEKSNISNYKEAVKSDLEIIELREEVTKSARSKLDNGVITSTEFITELNAETQAKINHETHKIKLVQSIVNYLYITGEI